MKVKVVEKGGRINYSLYICGRYLQDDGILALNEIPLLLSIFLLVKTINMKN